MTIERKVKYVASDGTEHDSPQEAARHDLRLDICRASGLPRYQAETTARYLADNPEALRDAVNAYFEALEEYPDVEPNPRLGSCDGEHFGPACIDPQCWHKQRLKAGEVAPGVRGFDMEVPKGMEVLGENQRQTQKLSRTGDQSVRKRGNPNDPSTWRVEIPAERTSVTVDHPNYCKPFGVDRD